MTPEEFNALMRTLEAALRGAPGINSAELGTPADDSGTEPELYVNVNGVDLALTASPL